MFKSFNINVMLFVILVAVVVCLPDIADAAPFEATNLTGTDTDIDKITDPGFYYGRLVTNSPFEFMFLEVGKGQFGGAGSRTYQKIFDLNNGIGAAVFQMMKFL